MTKEYVSLPHGLWSNVFRCDGMQNLLASKTCMRQVLHFRRGVGSSPFSSFSRWITVYFELRFMQHWTPIACSCYTRGIMWTRMPHFFGDAGSPASGPTAISTNVSNTSIMPEKSYKHGKLVRFYKSGYSDRLRSSRVRLMHHGLTFDPRVYAAFRWAT